MESVSGKNTTPISVLHFRGTRIEDLCLDFTLPGYNDYKLGSTPEYKMVNNITWHLLLFSILFMNII